MDRHLSYVAMTRHRDDVTLYVDSHEFADRLAGRLIDHGRAPYDNAAGNRISYYVMLETNAGARHRIWGVDLERAMAEARPKIGDKIRLEHTGSQTVQLPNGQTAERNSWRVQRADELAYRQLEVRLGRPGLKETTLDYIGAFAARRGIGEQLELDRAAQGTQERQPTQEQTRAERQLPRPSLEAEKVGEDRGKDRSDDRQQRQRNGMFDGLKLGRKVAAEAPQQGRSERPAERPEKTGTPRRSMFDGLKLKIVQENDRRSPDRQEACRPEWLQRPSEFEKAIDRYARAFSAAVTLRDKSLPVVDGQTSELRAAARQIEQARPGSSATLISAIRHDPEMGCNMIKLSGQARINAIVAGMDKERALNADPNVRADRLINRWRELETERKQLAGRHQDKARGAVEAEMRKVAEKLDRDPQVASVLRARETSMRPAGERSITRDIEKQMSRDRDQGLER
jgi:hypothetical protein